MYGQSLAGPIMTDTSLLTLQGVTTEAQFSTTAPNPKRERSAAIPDNRGTGAPHQLYCKFFKFGEQNNTSRSRYLSRELSHDRMSARLVVYHAVHLGRVTTPFDCSLGHSLRCRCGSVQMQHCKSMSSLLSSGAPFSLDATFNELLRTCRAMPAHPMAPRLGLRLRSGRIHCAPCGEQDMGKCQSRPSVGEVQVILATEFRVGCVCGFIPFEGGR